MPASRCLRRLKNSNPEWQKSATRSRRSGPHPPAPMAKRYWPRTGSSPNFLRIVAYDAQKQDSDVRRRLRSVSRSRQSFRSGGVQAAFIWVSGMRRKGRRSRSSINFRLSCRRLCRIRTCRGGWRNQVPRPCWPNGRCQRCCAIISKLKSTGGCRSSGRPACWRSKQSGRRALNDPQCREGLRRFNADSCTPGARQVFQSAGRAGVRLGPHIELIELKRIEFKIENGRDLDEERRMECVTEPRRSPIGAGRDLVGVELTDRTSRDGSQRRGRRPIGGLMVDVQVPAVRHIDDARPQSADRALDGADGIRQGAHIAVVLWQSGELRRLRAEQSGGLARRRAPFCILAAAVTAKNENMNGRTGGRMQRHRAPATQNFVEGMSGNDEDR